MVEVTPAQNYQSNDLRQSVQLYLDLPNTLSTINWYLHSLTAVVSILVQIYLTAGLSKNVLAGPQ